MAAVNNSNENGTVTLKDLGNGSTQVVLSLTPGTDTGAQPAHIHTGTCPGLGSIVYPLTSVVDGGSTSTVGAKLSDLEGGKYVINVHNSMQYTTYVSCGPIP
jgi:hypothetical protein